MKLVSGFLEDKGEERSAIVAAYVGNALLDAMRHLSREGLIPRKDWTGFDMKPTADAACESLAPFFERSFPPVPAVKVVSKERTP